jgi:L-asparaginase / beta-aspartyl-peptidase
VIVVASANGRVGIDAAWDVLARGGSALDAVEAGTRLVEDNPDDHSVGYSGLPNLVGVVELDASIMDGASRRTGAVGSLRGYRAAITVARAVMERLPHVLVVGDGAARLAGEIGLTEEHLLTPEAEKVWRDGLQGELAEGSMGARMMSVVSSLTADPERAAGTVNFIAIDRDGHLASAVSTSGWAWKFPGRLGDSPVIGAGNYCDDRFGAAACTGFGELAIRTSTARTVVAALADGASVDDAARAAIADIYALDVPPEQVIMSLVAVDPDGHHVAASTRQGATYVYRSDGMDGYAEAPRLVVDGT